MGLRWCLCVVLACATTGATGCTAEIPEGIVACIADHDCPPRWYCRSDDRCYSTRESGDSGSGGDAGSAGDSGAGGDGGSGGDAGTAGSGGDGGTAGPDATIDGGQDAGDDAANAGAGGDGGSGTGGASGVGGDAGTGDAGVLDIPVSVLFLVDRSGSMLCNAPPEQSTAECETGPLAATTKTPEQPTKWRLTADALRSVLGALTATGGVNAGLTLFSNNNVCGVHTVPNVGLQDLDTTHATSIADALDQAQPAGATPIVGGMLLAYQHLHWEASAGCQNPPCGAPGNRFVVLITDGADTCSMAADRIALLTTEVQKARSANIRTFVIGAPGSEPARGFLSELAFQGGTARNDGSCAHPSNDGDVGDCHFDLSTSTNLSADLVVALGDVWGMVRPDQDAGGSGSNPDVGGESAANKNGSVMWHWTVSAPSGG